MWATEETVKLAEDGLSESRYGGSRVPFCIWKSAMPCGHLSEDTKEAIGYQGEIQTEDTYLEVIFIFKAMKLDQVLQEMCREMP